MKRGKILFTLTGIVYSYHYHISGMGPFIRHENTTPSDHDIHSFDLILQYKGQTRRKPGFTGPLIVTYVFVRDKGLLYERTMIEGVMVYVLLPNNKKRSRLRKAFIGILNAHP